MFTTACRSKRRTRPARQPSPGFTLLEVLVVMAIIGIVAGMVTLRIGDRGREVLHEREARRLQQAIMFAAQAAIVRGRAYGLGLTASDYQFCERRKGRWHAVMTDRTLAPHALPDHLRIEVLSRLTHGNAAAVPEPQRCPLVRFLPSGEADTLRVRIEDETRRRHIAFRVSTTGKIEREAL